MTRMTKGKLFLPIQSLISLRQQLSHQLINPWVSGFPWGASKIQSQSEGGKTPLALHNVSKHLMCLLCLPADHLPPQSPRQVAYMGRPGCSPASPLGPAICESNLRLWNLVACISSYFSCLCSCLWGRQADVWTAARVRALFPLCS